MGKLKVLLNAWKGLLESIGECHDGVRNVLQLPFELGAFGSEFLPTCAHPMPILKKKEGERQEPNTSASEIDIEKTCSVELISPGCRVSGVRMDNGTGSGVPKILISDNKLGHT